MRQMINEHEMEKQEMKLILEEALSKVRHNEASLIDSEQKRIEIQKSYCQAIEQFTEDLEKEKEENVELRKKVAELD